MPTTSRGYRYPGAPESEPPNGPLQIANLASDINADVQGLATTLAGMPRSKHGGGNVATNATGFFTITHNLGLVPTYANVVSRRATGNFGSHEFAISAATATTITVRAYYNNDPDVSATFPIYWEVKA